MAEPHPDASGHEPGGPADPADTAADGSDGGAGGPDPATEETATAAEAVLLPFPAGCAPGTERPTSTARTVPASLRAFLG